ncbi:MULTISPECIES: hypothetical protein [Enterobacter]|uniref:hypothetical protein n=1 Tax=Enterobacter TaxID=547 RepID=UPI001D022534|nr:MULTISPECIES: hypothetical protein [Enterobacter]
MEITREQLRERAREKVKSLEFAVTQTAFADSRSELEEELELARIALASLEAEAVAWLYSASFERGHVEGELTDAPGCDMPVYTAPPATVSVMDEAQSRELFEKNCMANIERNKWHPDLYAHLPAREQWAAWEACRAAMLQGSDNEFQRKAAIHDALCGKYNVESLADFVDWQRNHIAELEAAPPAPLDQGETAVMPDYPGYALTQRECYQAGKKAGLAEAGNSPVIPDGGEHGFCQRHPDTRRLTHPYKQLLTYPPRSSTYCPKCDPEVSKWVERDKLLRQNKPDEERPYTVVMPGGCQHEWVHHVPCSRLKPEYEECYKCGVRRPYPAAPQQEE